MDIKNTIWFTQGEQAFGIVYGYDEVTKEPKAYIGRCFNKNEEMDRKHIAKYGVKMAPSIVKELSEFLNPKKKDS